MNTRPSQSTDGNLPEAEICPNCRQAVTKHRPWCEKYTVLATAPKEGDMVDDPVLGPTPLLSVYLREDAIADGTLVDCTQDPFDELNRNAGLIFDVAMTRATFERYVEVPRGYENQQDIQGRYWDIVFMFRWAAQKTRDCHELLFEFTCIPNGNGFWDNERPAEFPTHRLVSLKALAGPGDRGEPCITLMLPHED